MREVREGRVSCIREGVGGMGWEGWSLVVGR